MLKFKDKYGPWALITGASSGIGAEYVKFIAAQGLYVALVARNEDKLKALEKEIKMGFNLNAKIIVADLTTEESIDKVKKETSDLEIGLLVNNAGREDSDHFLNIPTKKHLETIDLNIKAPLLLTHYSGEKMTERKR